MSNPNENFATFLNDRGLFYKKALTFNDINEIVKAAEDYVKLKTKDLEQDVYDRACKVIDVVSENSELKDKIEKLDSWTSVRINPKHTGEYIVTVDLGDGEPPLTSCYQFDVFKGIWTDPVTDIQSHGVLFWKDLPEPKEAERGINIIHQEEPPIMKVNTLDEFERVVYGQCIHGENMISCWQCNKT